MSLTERDQEFQSLVSRIQQSHASSEREELLADLIKQTAVLIADYLSSKFGTKLSSEEREDVVWESCLKVAESIVHYEARGQFLSGVFRIARHTAIDHLKPKSRLNAPEHHPTIVLREHDFSDSLLSNIGTVVGKHVEFYSCFISHSAKDKPFCDRLHNDLQAKGVRTWYFPEDAKWGEPVWGEIDRSIKIYDKLVVVCSQNSLQSEPVIKEIARALNREEKEHKNILFPITLDRYVFDTWEHEHKADLLRKVIGEFCGWDSADALYRKAFGKLLKNLQAESARE